jgi:hypothetical protein
MTTPKIFSDITKNFPTWGTMKIPGTNALIELVNVSIDDLGFDEEGATLKRIIARASELKLRRIPVEMKAESYPVDRNTLMVLESGADPDMIVVANDKHDHDYKRLSTFLNTGSKWVGLRFVFARAEENKVLANDPDSEVFVGEYNPRVKKDNLGRLEYK